MLLARTVLQASPPVALSRADSGTGSDLSALLPQLGAQDAASVVEARSLALVADGQETWMLTETAVYMAQLASVDQGAQPGGEGIAVVLFAKVGVQEVP